MRAAEKNSGSRNLGGVVTCALLSSDEASLVNTARKICRPSINRSAVTSGDFSDDECSSSLSSNEMSALPATLVNHSANRYIGAVSPTEYNTTDEDTGSDSDSYYEMSGEYKPLGFTVIMGNQYQTPSKVRSSSFIARTAAEKQNAPGYPEDTPSAKYVVKRTRTLGEYNDYGFEMEEFEAEVEIEEGYEDTLDVVLMDKSTRQLRDPDLEVGARESKGLDRDDPNFEELFALRQGAAYIEVKETRLKAAKEGTLRTAGRFGEETKEMSIVLPEVMVVNKRERFINAGKSCELRDNMIQSVSPKHLEKIRLHDNRGRRGLLISTDFTYLPKEETFFEDEKPVRRKRDTKGLSARSLVIDALPEEAGGEILETECMSLGESQMKNHSSEVLGANSMKDGNNETIGGDRKITMRTTKSSSGKKERPQGRRSLSLVFGSVTEDLGAEFIDEADIIFHTKSTASEQDASSKKGIKYPSKKRRPRNNTGNRSVVFTEVAEDAGGEGIVEVVGERLTLKPIIQAPSNGTKANKFDRHSRRKNGSRSNLFFAVPQENAVEHVIEDDCQPGIAVNTQQGFDLLVKGKRDKKNETAGVSTVGSHEKTKSLVKEKQSSVHRAKKRHHRNSGANGSHELECSLTPDEVSCEFMETDDHLKIPKQKTGHPSHLSRDNALSGKNVRETSDNGVRNRELPLLSTNNKGSGANFKTEGNSNHLLSDSKLPYLADHNIPDENINSANSVGVP